MPDWWPPVELDPDNFSLERISSYYLDFGLVLDNMDSLLRAVLVTISLAFLAEFFGIVLGLALALLKISRSRILSAPAQLYIDIFRGTPLLVQITIIYFTTASVGLKIGRAHV